MVQRLNAYEKLQVEVRELRVKLRELIEERDEYQRQLEKPVLTLDDDPLFLPLRELGFRPLHCRILVVMWRRPNNQVATSRLMGALYGAEWPHTNTLKVHISTLNTRARKLGFGYLTRTFWGSGVGLSEEGVRFLRTVEASVAAPPAAPPQAGTCPEAPEWKQAYRARG